jgi:hypothetical protein
MIHFWISEFLVIVTFSKLQLVRGSLSSVHHKTQSSTLLLPPPSFKT